MKNIFRIFQNDLKELYKNLLALLLTIGLCILPALYAWLNVYANWDPYANTGNIQILVANEDIPFTDPSGQVWALGKEIETDLKTKTSIGWTFVDHAEDVTEGVKSGKFYAGIVIGPEFSESVYNGSSREEGASIHYYINAKKNAVATKITDSATSSVQASLTRSYIKHISQKLYNDIKEEKEEFAQDVETVGDALDENLAMLLKKTDEFDALLDSLLGKSSGFSSDLNAASSGLSSAQEKLEGKKAKIGQAQEKITDAKTTFRTISKEVSEAMTGMQFKLGSLQTQVQEFSFDEDGQKVRKGLKKIAGGLQKLENVTDKLIAVAEKVSGAEKLVTRLHEIRTREGKLLNAIFVTLNTDLLQMEKDNINELLETLGQGISGLRGVYTETVVPELNDLLDNLTSQAKAIQNLFDSIGQVLGSSGSILARTGRTLDAFDTSLVQLKNMTAKLRSRLKELQSEADKLDDDERVRLLTKLLSGDSDAVADYLSDPVVMETVAVYEVPVYGSGVTPFYSVLAIWFGMTVLLALFMVVPKKEPFTSFKPHQQYFGKYILFFLLSQIQTAIIVCGDLYLFHVQCLHPGLFFLAASVTSLTISILVYTLALSFGDLGKAICIILMVLQIAGSGGTYPIEALPPFFQNVYLFFPFPYAINAMRECIGGMYDGTYWKNLLSLLLFIAGALLIGLFVRLPFIKIFHFIEKRMEDTDIM